MCLQPGGQAGTAQSPTEGDFGSLLRQGLLAVVVRPSPQPVVKELRLWYLRSHQDCFRQVFHPQHC